VSHAGPKEQVRKGIVRLVRAVVVSQIPTQTSINKRECAVSHNTVVGTGLPPFSVFCVSCRFVYANFKTLFSLLFRFHFSFYFGECFPLTLSLLKLLHTQKMSSFTHSGISWLSKSPFASNFPPASASDRQVRLLLFLYQFNLFSIHCQELIVFASPPLCFRPPV
jgi:hypothetical protein